MSDREHDPTDEVPEASDPLEWWGSYSDPDQRESDHHEPGQRKPGDSPGTDVGSDPGTDPDSKSDAAAHLSAEREAAARRGEPLWGSWPPPTSPPVDPRSAPGGGVRAGAGSPPPPASASASAPAANTPSTAPTAKPRTPGRSGPSARGRRTAATTPGSPARPPRRRRVVWWVLGAAVAAVATAMIVRAVTVTPVQWTTDLASEGDVVQAFGPEVRVAESPDGQSTGSDVGQSIYDQLVIPLADETHFRGLVALEEGSGEPAWTHAVTDGLCAISSYQILCLGAAEDADATRPADGSPGVASSTGLVLEELDTDDGDVRYRSPTSLTSVRSLAPAETSSVLVLGHPGADGSDLGTLSLLNLYDGTTTWTTDLADLEDADLLRTALEASPEDQHLQWAALDNGYMALWLRPGFVLIDPATGPVLDHVQYCDGATVMGTTYFCTSYDGEVSPQTATVRQFYWTGREVEALPGLWTMATDTMLAREPLLVAGDNLMTYAEARGVGADPEAEPLTVRSRVTDRGLEPVEAAAFGSHYEATLVSAQGEDLAVMDISEYGPYPWCPEDLSLPGVESAQYLDVSPYGGLVLAWGSQQDLVMCSRYDGEVVSRMEPGELEGLLQGAELIGARERVLAIRDTTVTAIDMGAATESAQD